MTYNTQTFKPRIELVDAIRGFALLGILLIHGMEHFDFIHRPEYNPEFFQPINRWINRSIRFVFSGKSYSIFSLMFGFSFFVLMDRNANRGIDYRERFLWRMLVLFILGYLHSIFYIGEVLTIYAVLGILLVPIYHFNKKLLLALAILFFLQLPIIAFLLHSYNDAEFRPFLPYAFGGYRGAAEIFSDGSIWEVFRYAMFKGHETKWVWMINNGRITQLIGLFIMGLYIGKTGYFENLRKYTKTTLIVLGISIAVFSVFQILTQNLSEFEVSNIQRRLYRNLFSSYANVAFVAIIVTCFALIYDRTKVRFKGMALYGRMSLSSYIFQAVVGVPFFYGFGLGMYKYFNRTFSVLFAIIVYLLQLWFCHWWFKRYKYGPLEWLWRGLTAMKFSSNKLVKSSDTKMNS